jgi:hypothetical protein
LPDDQEEQKPYPLNDAVNSRKMVDDHCNNFSPSHPTVDRKNPPGFPRQINELQFLESNVTHLRSFCPNIIESFGFMRILPPRLMPRSFWGGEAFGVRQQAAASMGKR